MENNEWNDYKSFTVKAGTTSDWSEIILRMAEGNTTIKIAGVNNENNAAVLIVKAVTKSDNGGTNILNVGNCGQMTIKESIDFAGNITIGSKSKSADEPFLHFELWHKGTALDPTHYISF